MPPFGGMSASFCALLIVIETIFCGSWERTMPDIEKTVYKLYALPLTLHNIEIAASERFSRATPMPEPGYVLVYKSDNPPDGAFEITADAVNLLSPADERWLFDCNTALIAEQIELHEPDMLMGMAETISALENELKKKKEEFEKKGA